MANPGRRLAARDQPVRRRVEPSRRHASTQQYHRKRAADDGGRDGRRRGADPVGGLRTAPASRSLEDVEGQSARLRMLRQLDAAGRAHPAATIRCSGTPSRRTAGRPWGRGSRTG